MKYKLIFLGILISIGSSTFVQADSCGPQGISLTYFDSAGGVGPETIISGTSTTYVSGSKPDHTPDYDVFSNSAKTIEVSANHDNQPAKEVTAGSTLWHRLENETHNRDVVTSDLYDSGSQSIDGEIHCRVVGHTDWAELAGSEDQLEYDTDALHTDNTQDETITSSVPWYPGSILECKAVVDGDNEVNEENESNNNSRIERFLIVDNTPQLPPPPGGSSSPSLDCTGADKAKCAAIINIIFD